MSWLKRAAPALVLAVLLLVLAATKHLLGFSLAAIAGLAAIYAASRLWRSRGLVLSDERDSMVEALAARALLRAVFAGGGGTIIAYTLLRNFVATPPWIDHAMRVLTATLCTMLAAWLPIYIYYRWRLGG